MLNEIRKVGVFIKRDFKVMFTYKLAFSMAWVSLLFNFLYMVLFGSMFQVGYLSSIDTYGGNFISYILVGSIGWGFMWSVALSTPISLRSEMEDGTLESIISTPTSIYTMILSYTFFGSFFGLLSIAILLSVSYAFFGISVFATASIFTLIIFVLSVIMMMGFAMILGGLTFWIKNIGETGTFIQSISMFFCGVYFPITVLPEFLQPISKYVPFYWSIEGLRKSLIPSTPTQDLLNYVLILIIITFVVTSIGAYALHRGLKKAKKDGSLAFY